MRKLLATPLLVSGMLYASMFAAAPASASGCTTTLNLGECNSGACGVNGVNATCDGGDCTVNLSYCGYGCTATVNWGSCGTQPPPPEGECAHTSVQEAESGNWHAGVWGSVLLFDGNGLPVSGSLTCVLYVNGNEAFRTPTATGSGVVVTQMNGWYTAGPADQVQVCAEVTSWFGYSFNCTTP